MPQARSAVGRVLSDWRYATAFPATQNPILEDGGWVRGGTEGLDWTDPQTTAGFCWATMTTFDGVHFIDSIAHRRGFSPNHHIRGVIRNTGVGSKLLEVELLTRCKITPHNARGYEWDIVNGTQEVDLVRWNGAEGDFTTIASSTTNVSFAHGSVYDAYSFGPLLLLFCNGNLVNSVDVQAWALANGGAYWDDGDPGIGLWDQTGAPDNSLSWASWQAENIFTLPRLS